MITKLFKTKSSSSNSNKDVSKTILYKKFNIALAQYIGERKNQEDYVAVEEIEEGVLAIVADGLGGYDGGDVASSVVVNAFKTFFKENFEQNGIKELLLDATHFSNQKLLEEKKEKPELEEMGTTLLAVYMTQNQLYWVSVGDTLLYHFNTSKKINIINENHSVGHLLRSYISGYVIDIIELKSIEIQTQDNFLLASDGIETLSNDVIEETFKEITSPQNISETLIELVKKAKKRHQDNVSLVVLRQEES